MVAGDRTAPRAGFLGIPVLVWGVALLFALLHATPFWRACLAVPDGWEFTGNLSAYSPDSMQYRVWFEQTAETGPLVDNRFTAEPNRPYLPVVYFWAAGGLARFLGLDPMTVHTCAGSLFAALITLLVFVAVRRFTSTPARTWWLFGLALLGGGLGGHIRLMDRFEFLRGNALVQSWILDPAQLHPPFEDYRGNYTYQALFEAFAGLQWALGLGTLLLLHSGLRSGRRAASVAAVLLASATTVLHLYTGITIAAVAATAAGVLYLGGHRSRGTWVPAAALVAAVGATLAVLRLLYDRGGLPMPTWEAITLHPVVLLLAYPLVWAVLPLGLRSYVRRAGPDRLFLLGWALGCLALMVSGPLYPYPDRGALTAQVPLVLIAGGIWFDRVGKVGPVAALVVLAVAGLSPALRAYDRFAGARFHPKHPPVYLSPDHLEVTAALGTIDDRRAVLLSEYPETLWLAPAFGGVNYCGHFFLTLDYEAKQERVTRFYAGDADERAAILSEVHPDMVWIPDRDRPEGMPLEDGWSVLVSNGAGTLLQRGSVDER